MLTPAPMAALPDSTASNAPNAEPLPLAPEFVRALGAGVVWGLITYVVAGLQPGALLPLCVGGAWTQLLLLLATGAMANSAALRARLALGAAVLGLGALVIGQVLQTHTHHRPLGAVVWVLLLAGLCVPVAAVVQRVKPSSWLGFGALGLTVLVLVWHGRSAASLGVWIQALAGLVCCAGAVFVRSRWPRTGAALALPVTVLMAAGAGWVLWSGQGTSLFSHAPFTLGALGLL